MKNNPRGLSSLVVQSPTPTVHMSVSLSKTQDTEPETVADVYVKKMYLALDKSVDQMNKIQNITRLLLLKEIWSETAGQLHFSSQRGSICRAEMMQKLHL